MKIFQPLTLLLLLVVFAMAWATWDMQRREAVAPGVDLQGKAPPTATTNDVLPVKTNAVVVIPKAVCPTCHGKKEVHVEKEVACRACGGDGIIQGALSAHSTTVCNSCKGSGKIIKDVTQECPVCKATGQIPQAMAADFKACPKCKGAKTIEVEESFKCQNCGGSGKMGSGFRVTNDSGGHTSRNKQGGQTATHAAPAAPVGGTQVCTFCDGTGKKDKKVKHACPDCFGSGVTYQPPPPPPPPQPNP